ncbi:MAG: glycosyltransferase family 39 protein [Holosporaceae bacterium]|jgi:4-amino-4-deoxy-L-arabinose transferase-like glycosyltransferase|nr:glycosyltransferase family 39 protein [Holosporaceae bacterium]
MWKDRRLQFILTFGAVFAVVPMVVRNILPYDMVENLYWGKELQPGYVKHPPLFAWVSYFFYEICFSWPESLYVLTQLNLLLGFYFIFRTSRLIFGDETKSYASIFIFMSSVCAVFGNEKFNANTVLISLFPMMFFFFVRLLKFNRKMDALALGLASALAFLGKYFALLYIGCLWLFLIFDRHSRRMLKTPLPYVAAAVFLLGIGWHLAWMWNSDFVSLKYSLDKSINAPTNFFSCFNFLLMQTVFFSTSFLAFKYSYSGKMRFLPLKDGQFSSEERFIIFITIIPNLLLFAVSLMTGMRIGSFWGTNMLMMLGVYLLIINGDHLNHDRLFRFVKGTSFVFAVILLAKLGVARCLLGTLDPTNALNLRSISDHIQQDWQSRFPGQKMTILKTDKATAALHLHLEDSPSSYDVARNDQYRIYDRYPTDTKVAVAFLCSKNGGEIKYFRDFYKTDILFDNMVSVTEEYSVYYAFLEVKNDDDRSRHQPGGASI